MSITTKHGDTGRTRLLFGDRAEKHHPALHAAGDADELNAVLGMARLHVQRPGTREAIARVQDDLIALMGMISAGPEGAERYAAQGFRLLTADSLTRLTSEAAAMEAEFPGGFRTWSVPGAAGDHGSAWLELARTVCRRAERSLTALPEGPWRTTPTAWLNRLSDWLWLAARCEELRP
jgi:cob(I)alamin adenosyltransferase